ncbi:MAG: glycerophosphodiester phosphodiesterase [Pirellulales bacterium]|nr:glycerophosphodiester phosphodiesterase [Pirellulales bacterium]
MGELVTPASGQLIIGHRGASHDAPENTLAAFKLAIEQGGDGFEGDYWLGAGDRIVCLHDADTKRVAGVKLSVTRTPWEQLRALDIGSWKAPQWKDERIPTYEQCLAILPAGKKFFVELKSKGEVVAPIRKAIVESKFPREQIVFISFHASAIAECKKQMPDVKALWLCGFDKPKKKGDKRKTADEVADTLDEIHADGLNAQAVPDYVDAKFIARLRERGYPKFGVWTVDDPKVAKFYADLGASAITTNRPGWLREQLHDNPR